VATLSWIELFLLTGSLFRRGAWFAPKFRLFVLTGSLQHAKGTVISFSKSSFWVSIEMSSQRDRPDVFINSAVSKNGAAVLVMSDKEAAKVSADYILSCLSAASQSSAAHEDGSRPLPETAQPEGGGSVSNPIVINSAVADSGDAVLVVTDKEDMKLALDRALSYVGGASKRSAANEKQRMPLQKTPRLKADGAHSSSAVKKEKNAAASNSQTQSRSSSFAFGSGLSAGGSLLNPIILNSHVGAGGEILPTLTQQEASKVDVGEYAEIVSDAKARGATLVINSRVSNVSNGDIIIDNNKIWPVSN
jgi:hypothetical protein